MAKAKAKTTADITPDTTREEMEAMVKGVMEDRKEVGQELAETGESGTSKETHVGDDTSVDDDAASGQDDAGGEDSGEESNDDSQEQSWLTDAVRAELPRWVSDEDLSEFSSRDELDRALGLMDRAAMKAGREASRNRGDEEDQEPDDAEQRGHERGKDGKFRKQQREERRTEDESVTPFKIDLDLSEFDEDLSKKVNMVFTGLRDHYEGRLKALDERFTAIEADNQGRQAAAVESQFDAIVDSLGYPELFGRSGQESEKQLEARRKLFDETDVYLAGLRSFGRNSQMEKRNVERVFRGEFADYLSKHEHKQRTQRITKQSSLRMGIGVERPAEQPFKGPLKNHPDVQRAYKKLQEARGDE